MTFPSYTDGGHWDVVNAAAHSPGINTSMIGVIVTDGAWRHRGREGVKACGEMTACSNPQTAVFENFSGASTR